MLTLMQPVAAAAAPVERQTTGTPAEASAAFLAAFGVPFSILDGSSGNLLLLAPGQPARDWGLRGELAREVARRSTPQFIEAGGPLVTLAVPVDTSLSSDFVAISTLVIRPTDGTRSDLAEAAELLGTDLDEARDWIAAQPVCPAETLLRIAALVREQCETRRRLARFEQESALWADQVATIRDELNLLYCLTQNLRITADDDQLVRLSLEWLGNVVPSQGLALLWTDEQSSSVATSRNSERFVTRGRCPCDRDEFAELMDFCGQSAGQGPYLLNAASPLATPWPYAEIRHLIAAPLVSAGRRLGWLAAFNRADREGFRQVEANLFSSVATILGIHRENTDLFRDQSDLVAGVVHALTSAIDAKDSFTSGHSDRVARLSVRLGQELGCTADELKSLYLGGLLHDVGKIGIDDDVLRKTGELTATEYEHIKHHPRIGYQILADLKKFQHVLPVVLYHHEAWDGSGYPDGLVGEETPLLARIVSVADAFDAMASRRPYRPGMPLEKLDDTFRSGSGRQWDPRIIDAFFAIRADAVAILEATPLPARLMAPGWT